MATFHTSFSAMTVSVGNMLDGMRSRPVPWGALVNRLGRSAIAAYLVYSLVRCLKHQPELERATGLAFNSVQGVILVGLVVAFVRLARRDSEKWTMAMWTGAARFLFVSMVAGVVAFQIWLQPFRAIVFEVTFGAWLAAVTVGFELAHFARPLSKSWAWRAIDFVLWTACVLSVGTEVGLRAVAWVNPMPIFAAANASPAATIERMRFPHGLIVSGFPCDQNGFYDSPLSQARQARRRVAVIGDSFCFAAAPHHYHYTTVCERILGDAEFLNIGAVCIGPDEYEHLLRVVVKPLEPDLIVISLFLGNDLTDTRLVDRSYPFARRWLERENTLVYLLGKRLAALAAERRRLGPESEFLSADLQAPVAPTVKMVDGPAVHDAFPWIDDPTKEIPLLSPEAFFSLEETRARVLSQPNTRSYRNLFSRLEAIRRAAGRTPLVFLLIPDEFQLEDALWAQVKPAEATEIDRDRAQGTISAWMDERGVANLDLLPLLRSTPRGTDGRRALYHSRDTHFNTRGHVAAGMLLASYLAARPDLLPP